MHILRIVFWSLCFCVLTGCGQSGPLYLPGPESLENAESESTQEF